MRLSFYYSTNTTLLAAFLFVSMVACVFIGRWLSKNRATGAHAKNPGNAAMTTSLYALLGLLLAFTFGMSGDRFRARRAVIAEESNAISTAALRLQLYADSVQPHFKKYFKEYIHARIAYFNSATDTVKIRQSLMQSQAAGEQLFKIAALHARNPANLIASNQMIPALNAMFDIANLRFWSEYNRTPQSILSMLFLLCLSAALVAGHMGVGEGQFDWIMAIGFCALISCVIFFIIDLDRPRAGVITLEENARAISDLRLLID